MAREIFRYFTTLPLVYAEWLYATTNSSTLSSP